MTRDDIIRMAEKAGFQDQCVWDPVGNDVHERFTAWPEDIERFAALVAAAEREACAKVCEGLTEIEIMPGFTASTRTDQFECAAAIRARGQA